MLCPPVWSEVPNGVCPFGTALPGDITLPNDANFFDLLMVIYGYVPYVVILGGFFALCWYRGTAQLAFLFFGGGIVFFGELIWKPILSQSRPYGSCLTTCGMPSSHATISIGFLTWMLLEGLFRKKRHGADLVSVDIELPDSSRARTGSFWEDDSPVARITPKQRAKWCIFWIVVLLPVPFSRVALRDHSWAQVSVGSVLGALEALAFYFILSRFGAYLEFCFIGKSCLRNGRTCGLCIGPLFSNNYEPNHFPKRATLVKANIALARASRARPHNDEGETVPQTEEEAKLDSNYTPP